MQKARSCRRQLTWGLRHDSSLPRIKRTDLELTGRPLPHVWAFGGDLLRRAFNTLPHVKNQDYQRARSKLQAVVQRVHGTKRSK